jgi:hypothetical protein
MDWYQVGVAAACGGVAALIGAAAGSLVRNAKYKPIAVTVVTVVMMAVLFAWAKTTIVAEHKHEVALAEFEALAKDNPAFGALREYAPEVMTEVRSYLGEAVKQSHTPLQIETRTREIIFGVVTGRLSRASDAAVINSVQLSVDQMKWLHARGDDSCFRYLFPQVGGGISAAEVFSEELLARDYESTRRILSTYDEDRAIPSAEQATAILNPIYLALFEKYGQDRVAQLADVTAPGIDREEICTISTDLYVMILAGADEEAVTVLRWMFDQFVSGAT